MPEPTIVQQAQSATAPTTIPKSWEQLSKELDAIAREAGKEAAGDRIKEFVERERAENKRLTETQKAKKFFRSMKNVRGNQGRGTSTGRVRGINQISEMSDPDEVVGVKFARALPLLVKFGGDATKAAAHAEKHGHADLAAQLLHKEKTMNATNFAAGGAALPSQVSDDIIGFLYDNSLVRSMGALVIPNPTGDMIMPKQTGTTTGYWVGENQVRTVSEVSLGAIKLATHTVSIAIPVSQHLSSLATGAFNQMIYNDASRIIRNTEDIALIRSDGSQWRPTGIKSQVAASQKFVANASNLFADVTADLFKLQYRVEGSGNIGEPTSPGFMLSKRDAFFLKSQISADGTFIFLPQMMAGQLIDAPWGASNHIPKNLGGGGDESEIYYGDFGHLLIGQVMGMEVRVYEGAAFLDGNGNPVYGAQQGVDLIVIQLKMDSKLRHDTAFAIAEECTWGAGLDT